MKRVALVTGAAGGIGSAVVRAFAAAGWSVLATDRRTDVAVEEATHFYAADVSREADVITLVGEVRDATDRLDALVNNAAVQRPKPLLEMDAAEWDDVLASNLRSAYLTARRMHSLLSPAAGSIVNISSVHALATSVGMAAYAASKGGLVALTRAMALEFAPEGIRVNALLPGAVDTPMLHEGLNRGHLPGSSSADRLGALSRRTPLGRIGRPDEIAQAALFLADGDRSSFITGETLIVDGGALARLSTE